MREEVNVQIPEAKQIALSPEQVLVPWLKPSYPPLSNPLKSQGQARATRYGNQSASPCKGDGLHPPIQYVGR